jgi:4-hydroxy 2-oxovalerate aldolase
MSEIKINQTKLLDCTIRDGGYVNDWNFTQEQMRELYVSLNNANIDYMEIGFKTIKKPEYLKKFGPQYFSEEEYINSTFGDIYQENGCKLAIMCQLDIMDINDFVPKKDSLISMVRVLQAYHGFKEKSDEIIDIDLLQKGLVIIKQLSDLGYEVCFNIGRIDKISFEQLHEICERLATTNITYFYMADTYGSTDLWSVEKYVKYVKNLFCNEFGRNDIKIGFHAHNNYQSASMKSMYALKCGAEIIDGCVHGFGRGSGNAITELLMIDMNKNCEKNYDFIHVLKYGEDHLTLFKNNGDILSYSQIIYILSAYYGMHVNYAVEIIEKYEKIDILKINNVFKKIHDENKHMFFFSKLLHSYIQNYNQTI